MADGFVPDENIQKVAEAWALDAVDFASERFSLTLDWSEGSVRHVETILGALHERVASR